jgi:DNA-binding NarL/FixJ family response regulator
MNLLPSKRGRRRDTIKLLIVDDSEAVKSSLCEFVAGLPGLEVVGTGTNGVEALALVAACRPDLVVMDLSMPVMDGLEALLLIRQRHPVTRIIMTTICDGAEVEARCLAGGADAFLTKQRVCKDLAETVVKLFPERNLK